jgi:hypothetical protein
LDFFITLLEGQPPRPTLGILNNLTSEECPANTEQERVIKNAKMHNGILNNSLSGDHLNQASPARDSATNPDKDIKDAKCETRDLAILKNEDDDLEVGL